MLIDTILRQFPIPKIYIRSKIDIKTQLAYREVVDGQQRLRAIIEFANDDFPLGSRAKEYSRLTYQELSEEDKQVFLSYTIAVEHLINASDDNVLEIFSRLNSYTLPLNAAELRHAKYQGDFKWAIHEASRRHSAFLERYGVLTRRRRVRMADDALLAAMYGLLVRGISDGGARAIDQLYSDYEDHFKDKQEYEGKVDDVIKTIRSHFGDLIKSVPTLARPPHLLMLFAAVTHAIFGIRRGAMKKSNFPTACQDALSNVAVAIENLEFLADLIAEDRETIPRRWQRFNTASRASTHRLSSRSVRFPIYFQALRPKRLASI